MKRRTATRPLVIPCPACGKPVPSSFGTRNLTCPNCKRAIVVSGRKAHAKVEAK